MIPELRGVHAHVLQRVFVMHQCSPLIVQYIELLFADQLRHLNGQRNDAFNAVGGQGVFWVNTRQMCEKTVGCQVKALSDFTAQLEQITSAVFSEVLLLVLKWRPLQIGCTSPANVHFLPWFEVCGICRVNLGEVGTFHDAFPHEHTQDFSVTVPYRREYSM